MISNRQFETIEFTWCCGSNIKPANRFTGMFDLKRCLLGVSVIDAHDIANLPDCFLRVRLFHGKAQRLYAFTLVLERMMMRKYRPLSRTRRVCVREYML